MPWPRAIVQLRLGESQATGRTSWAGGDVPRLDAKVVLNRIDLDRFLPDGVEPAPSDAASGSTGEGQSVDTASLVPLQTIANDIRRMIPTATEADVDFTIDALTWREGVIRQATAHLALADGVVTIGPASALLPGGAKVDIVGRLTADGDGRWMHSVAEVAAEDLRAILSWLGVDVGDIPADRLRRLSASADLSASGDRIAASGLDIRVDTTRIAGNAAVVTGARPQIAADLAVDAVNVDAYLAAAGAAPSGAAEPASSGETATLDNAPQEGAQASPDPAADDPWAVLDEIDADVALTVDALTYDGIRLAGLELDAALEDGDLTVRRASVEDAAGARASVTGVARAVATEPSFDLAVEGAADSLDGVAALLDIDPDIRTEAFGKATLNGSFAGDEEALEVDFALAAGPSTVRLDGTVERPFDEPAADLALRLHASSAAALARAAGLTPPPVVTRLGSLAIDGDIDGNLDSVALELSAETAGVTVQIDGRVTDPFASPGYSVDVDLSHPHAEALIETLVGASAADVALGALRISGKVSGDRTVANFGDVAATMGESTLGGGVFLLLEQEPPVFSAELHGGVLDLAWLGGGLAASRESDDDLLRLTADDPASTGIDGATPASARWSEETIDLAVLDRLSGTLTLDAETLVLGDYRIDRAVVDLAAAEGTLTLRSLTGRLFDGALTADGSLTGGPAPAGQAAFGLVDAELGAILRAAAGLDDVSGQAEADGYVTLRGQSEREMIRSLAGRVAFKSRGGTIEGVDVPAISRQIEALSKVDALEDIPSFVEQTEQSLSTGQTAIRSLDGTVRVQDGQARIERLRDRRGRRRRRDQRHRQPAGVAAGSDGAVPSCRSRGRAAGRHTLRRADRPARAPLRDRRDAGPSGEARASLARGRTRDAQDHAPQGSQGGARNRDGQAAAQRVGRSGRGGGLRAGGRAGRAHGRGRAARPGGCPRRGRSGERRALARPWAARRVGRYRGDGPPGSRSGRRIVRRRPGNSSRGTAGDRPGGGARNGFPG